MKSSFSGANGGNCIEVHVLGDTLVELEETDKSFNGDCCQAFITSKENFAAFIKGVKAGEFDGLLDS